MVQHVCIPFIYGFSRKAQNVGDEYMYYVSIQPVVPNKLTYCTSFCRKCWMCVEQNALACYPVTLAFIPVQSNHISSHDQQRVSDTAI